MAQESLRQRALYELRVFGIPFVRALEVAAKVRTVAAGLRSGVRPENAARLTFADLDLITRVDRAVARESTREVLEQAAALVALSNLTAIAGAVLEIHSLIMTHIAPRIYEGFRTGDALFYDLTNRQRAGLEMGPTVLLSLQKVYDRYSHSGLYVEEDGVSALLHGLRIKVKRLGWEDAVYLPRRRLDFAKIFTGYALLPPDDQLRVDTAYQHQVRQFALLQDQLGFEPPTLAAAVRMFVTSRAAAATPALFKRKVDPRPGDPIPPSSDTPTPPPIPDIGLDGDLATNGEPIGDTNGSIAPAALPCDLDRAATQRGPGRDPLGQPTDPRPTLHTGTQLSPAAVDGGPGPAPTMLCSGFTASILLEAMDEVRRSLPDLESALQFQERISVDVHLMTPGDLHAWPIWYAWPDDGTRPKQPRFAVFADEIVAPWLAADRTLC